MTLSTKLCPKKSVKCLSHSLFTRGGHSCYQRRANPAGTPSMTRLQHQQSLLLQLLLVLILISRSVMAAEAAPPRWGNKTKCSSKWRSTVVSVAREAKAAKGKLHHDNLTPSRQKTLPWPLPLPPSEFNITSSHKIFLQLTLD